MIVLTLIPECRASLSDRSESFNSLQAQRRLLDIAMEMFSLRFNQCTSKMNAGLELSNIDA
jgi:hypothetical protein